MFCQHCGSPLVENARFCDKCGTPQNAAAAPVVTPPVAAPEVTIRMSPNLQQSQNAPPISQTSLADTQAIPTPPVQAPVYTEPVYTAPVYTQQVADPAPTIADKKSAGKKSNTAVVIAIVVLAVLLVAAAIVIAASSLLEDFQLPELNLFGSSQDEDDDDDDDRKKNDDADSDDSDDREEVSTTVADVEEAAPTEAPATGGFTASNPYYHCYDPATETILSTSSQSYLCAADVSHLSQEALTIAYHEISARHGASFSDPNVQAYFNACSWYTAGAPSELSLVEQRNQELLQANLDLLSGALYRSNNAYIPYFSGTDSYMIADSNTRYLTAEDLENATDEQLNLIRNEIYARHGYIFKTDALREFFYCKQWYQPSIENDKFDTDVFSKVESSNVKLVQVYERLMDGVTLPDSNRYAPYYDPYYEYIIADSSTRKLSDYDLSYLDLNQLILARNEIYARNGYGFDKGSLFEYFAQCSWYRPTIAPGRKDEVVLNSVEKANVQLLEKYENALEKVPENLYSVDRSLTRTVETPYFTVNVPKYWKDIYKVTKKKSGSDYFVTFYEGLSYELYGGGRLFTIGLYTNAEDYYYLPNYQEFGYLTDLNSGQSYYVVLSYPTDVQVHYYPLVDLYSSMSEDIEDIMDTFLVDNDFAFYIY